MGVALSAGCGRQSSGSGQSRTSHVRVLTGLYSGTASKLGHAPRDEQEFKSTIAALPVSLDKLHVGSVDELFVSERDNQPLEIAYGKPKGRDVVIHEKTGVNGKRYVGHRVGMVEELDEEAFQKAVSGAQ
jgi:hypothetical protein